MAITPQDNSAFLREVDEEVRKDKATEFWRRWGIWLAIALVVGLAAFGGWLYWNNHQTQAGENEAAELSAVLDALDEGQVEGIDDRLAALSESSRPGIRAAAMLTRADVALQTGDTDAAVAHFAAVVADEALPQQFRDLALIRQTATEYAALRPQAVIDRLSGLAQPGNPWFGSAGELTAIALMAQDKNDEAGALFARMANDETVPETLRTRAVQMAGILGVDAVPDEPVDMDVAQAEPATPTQEESDQ